MELLALECQDGLAEGLGAFAQPLEEMQRQLVAMLAPQSLNPTDPNNALLALERAFADGVAELEAAGHWREELTLFEYVHRLARLEKRAVQHQ